MNEGVVAFYGTDLGGRSGEYRAVGTVVGYSSGSQYLIQLRNGEKIWWNERLVRRATAEELMKAQEKYEERHCFKHPAHEAHEWHNQYWCSGAGINPETHKINVPEPVSEEPHLYDVTEDDQGRVVLQLQNRTIGLFTREQLDKIDFNADEEFAKGTKFEFAVQDMREQDKVSEAMFDETPWQPTEQPLFGDAPNYFLPKKSKQEPEVTAEAEPMSDTDMLLASRLAVYGDRIDNMERVAKIWSGLLGVEIHDWQVPLLMSAYKMFRTFQTPDYSDNSDDIDGWKKMFVEVMNANHGGIVQARTVEEYESAKAALYVEDEVQAAFEKADILDPKEKLHWVGSDNPNYQKAETSDPCDCANCTTANQRVADGDI